MIELIKINEQLRSKNTLIEHENHAIIEQNMMLNSQNEKLQLELHSQQKKAQSISCSENDSFRTTTLTKLLQIQQENRRQLNNMDHDESNQALLVIIYFCIHNSACTGFNFRSIVVKTLSSVRVALRGVLREVLGGVLRGTLRRASRGVIAEDTYHAHGSPQSQTLRR